MKKLLLFALILFGLQGYATRNRKISFQLASDPNPMEEPGGDG